MTMSLETLFLPAATATRFREEKPVSDPKVIEDAADVRAFVTAGNATFTLRSKKSGERFTYKVSRTPEDGSAVEFFVNLLVDPDNEHGYKYLGHIFRRDGNYVHGRKSTIGQDAPSARAFAWFHQKVMVEKKDPASLNLEFWHEGKCGRCGRKLTVPESIARGLGPECASR